MNKINYQKELEKEIASIVKSGIKPHLLLHACCAPCSSYCLEYLHKYFNITVLFYNPNISPKEEYEYREKELRRLISDLGFCDINCITADFTPDVFYSAVKGYEDCAEGGMRCEICYKLRLSEAARLAKRDRYDYFCTTLSISPLKNAQKLNSIGKALAEEYGVKYLFSDFKKNEGYKRSIELSNQFGLYRQNYCGCIYSKNQQKTD